MNPLALLFLLAPVHAGTDPQASSSAQAAESRLEVYDLSSLALLAAGASEPLEVGILPALDLTPRYLERTRDDGAPMSVDAVVELILNLYGEEFEREGRSLRLGANGRLVVRGPDDLHAKVRELLVFLDEAVNAPLALRIDFVRVPPGVALPFEGARVREADAEAWLRGQSGRRSFRVDLRPDRISELDLSRDRPFLLDYDVEISSSSVAGDPIVPVASIGTRVQVRGVPAPGGLMLAFLMARSEQVGEGSASTLKMRSRVITEKGPLDFDVGGVLQSPDVLNGSLALDAFLPSGDALVIDMDLGLARQARREVVVLRAVGSAPVLRTFPASAAGAGAAVRGVLVASSVDFVDPPRCRTAGLLLDPRAVPKRLGQFPNYGQEGLLLSARIDEKRSVLVGAIVSELGGVMRRVELGRTVLYTPDRFAARDAAAVGDDAARLARALDGLRPESRLLDASVTVRAPGEGGPPARVRLPLRAGETCALALGIESFELQDVDVEVAQQAFTPDPVVMMVFEGLALWMHPMFGPSGDLLVDVSGGVSLRAGDPEHVQVDSLNGELFSQTAHEHLFVRERLVFAADQAGPWRAVLGDAGGLRLEVEIAR